jgi:hypothetical protein
MNLFKSYKLTQNLHGKNSLIKSYLPLGVFLMLAGLPLSNLFLHQIEKKDLHKRELASLTPLSSRHPSQATRNCHFNESSRRPNFKWAQEYIYFFSAMYGNDHAQRLCPNLVNEFSTKNQFVTTLQGEPGDGSRSRNQTFYLSRKDQIEVLSVRPEIEVFEDERGQRVEAAHPTAHEVFFRILNNQNQPGPVLRMLIHKYEGQEAEQWGCGVFDSNWGISFARQRQDGSGFEVIESNTEILVRHTRCWPRNR